MEDACDWLSKPFESLITRLAPGTLDQPHNSLPTLAQYLFPPHFVCSLAATDEKIQAFESACQDHEWGNPMLLMGSDFLDDLESRTDSYRPEEVDIHYENPRDILIKPPRKAIVGHRGGKRTECFFKRFNLSFGAKHARMELMAHKRIAQAQLPPPPDAWICRLHGVVRDGNKLAGMLFN